MNIFIVPKEGLLLGYVFKILVVDNEVMADFR